MKCFYHCDQDGFCAGSIVAKYENNYNREDFFKVDYVTPLPINKIEKDEKVYFVDYSFDRNLLWQLEEILKITQNIIWLDHHRSSLRLENEFTWLKDIKGIRKEGISGAALTYMYLYNCNFDDIPYYIKLVSDYDCWVYKYDPDTTCFKLGMETLECDALDDIWIQLYNSEIAINSRYIINDIINAGQMVKKYIDEDNKQYRDAYSYESEIAGYKCLVVNKKTNSWVFGEKYNKYPLVMVWVFDGSKYVYSIFSSNKDIDCSKIAESYDGGGSFGAAGFKSDELLFKKMN